MVTVIFISENENGKSPFRDSWGWFLLCGVCPHLIIVYFAALCKFIWTTKQEAIQDPLEHNQQTTSPTINIESRWHLHCMHQLYVCPPWLTCESGEAGAGRSAAQVRRSRLWYALSRAGEMCCAAKTLPRSGLPASAICTEPRGGSNKGSRRREGEEKEEGGPNKHVPQRTLAGSNPAWVPFQHRKLPVVRLECNAGRLINGQQQQRRGERERAREKRKSGNRKESVVRVEADVHLERVNSKRTKQRHEGGRKGKQERKQILSWSSDRVPKARHLAHSSLQLIFVAICAHSQMHMKQSPQDRWGTKLWSHGLLLLQHNTSCYVWKRSTHLQVLTQLSITPVWGARRPKHHRTHIIVQIYS